MALSEEQIRIIADHPLDDSLDPFTDKLRDSKESNEAWRTDVASLLGALVLSTTAVHLPPSDASGNVPGKLLAMRKAVQGGSLKFSHFRPLINAIVAQSPDTEIWTAVINLIEAINPSTPPPPGQIVATKWATPVSRSSKRVPNSETRDVVEHELFYEIRHCTHRGVPGFFEKHFELIKWSRRQGKMFKAILENHNGTKWEDFPANPKEKDVWSWLVGLQSKALTEAKYRLRTNKSANEFKVHKGQMDIFFEEPRQTDGDRFYYNHVLVVGEHKQTHHADKFKALLLQLTRHVRSIFDDQPMRRFVHAFTIQGTIMELWVFDRSGPYSSGEFDIHREPNKFARALVAYATMDDDAMGLDRAIEWKNKSRYIKVKGADGKDEREELNELLVKQCAVVCRGTTCFRTPKGVAKFSWRSAKRQPSEVKHLKAAREKGVQGVATLVGHREILTIADLRAGMEFSKDTLHTFRINSHDESDGYNRLQDSDTSGSSKKRKSSDQGTRPATRRRSNSQKSALRQAHNDDDRTSEEANDKPKPSLYTPDKNDPYENRILSCLIVSPAGRVISDFKSIRELLEALRDAIKAHQSLYLKGRILHRDISSNNIIITKPSESGGFNGMLIDLDLAKERDSEPSGASNQTGTMQFMAIEVLRGADHTYRHDLESFFYVLLWMCARRAWDKDKELRGDGEVAPAESDLRDWEIGRFKDIARAKEGDMTVNGVERIMREFPKCLDVVKPMCLQIRRLLFPLDRDGRMMIGTPAGEPERLYDAILSTFDKAIGQM